jgi:uncharacterized membrane protein YphA (DoxX/SURF4 family)
MSAEKRTAIGVSLVRVAIGTVAVGHAVSGAVIGFDATRLSLLRLVEGVTGACVLLGVGFRPSLALLGVSMLVLIVGRADGGRAPGVYAYALQAVGVLAGLAIAGPGRYTLAWVVRRFRGETISYPVSRKSSDVFGLSYIPSLEPHYSDDADFILGKQVDAEVTDRDLKKLEEVVLENRDTCQLIVEIGVCRNDERSFTHVLLRNKRDETVYLGIDLDDKSFLDDPKRNVHTLRTGSGNQALVRAKIEALGGHTIGILFIDGWHSVNMVANDWKYADLLAADGIVVMHDTSCHPGPVCVFDAVDERLFQKEKFFERERDWGLAVFRRRGPA